MARLNLSAKRIQIDKANTTVVLLVSFAAFIVTFSIFATKAMLSQRAYQNSIIKDKTTALRQLEENIEATKTLVSSYEAFVKDPTNVIGGSSTGLGDQDGDNAKIVLDALPSKYDFPAVTASLEKLLRSGNFKLDSIKGIDDEINQQTDNKTGLVEIPFEAVISGPYAGTNEAIVLLERSIRPFQVDTLTLTGGEKQMVLTVLGKTFYQPEKSLEITYKDVK